MRLRLERHPYDETLTGLEDWPGPRARTGARIAYEAEAEVIHVQMRSRTGCTIATGARHGFQADYRGAFQPV